MPNNVGNRPRHRRTHRRVGTRSQALASSWASICHISVQWRPLGNGIARCEHRKLCPNSGPPRSRTFGNPGQSSSKSHAHNGHRIGQQRPACTRIGRFSGRIASWRRPARSCIADSLGTSPSPTHFPHNGRNGGLPLAVGIGIGQRCARNGGCRIGRSRIGCNSWHGRHRPSTIACNIRNGARRCWPRKGRNRRSMDGMRLKMHFGFKQCNSRTRIIEVIVSATITRLTSPAGHQRVAKESGGAHLTTVASVSVTAFTMLQDAELRNGAAFCEVVAFNGMRTRAAGEKDD